MRSHSVMAMSCALNEDRQHSLVCNFKGAYAWQQPQRTMQFSMQQLNALSMFLVTFTLIQGIPGFRDLTIRYPRYFVILFWASFHDFEENFLKKLIFFHIFFFGTFFWIFFFKQQVILVQVQYLGTYMECNSHPTFTL